MIEETDDLISEYFNEEANQYGLSLEHVKLICKVPFYYFKKAMALAELPIIHIKYFGKFLIFPSKAKGIIRAITEKFQREEITEEEFVRNTVNLKKHIDEYEGEDQEDTDGGEATD